CFLKAEEGLRDSSVTEVQTCALPISRRRAPGVLRRRHRPRFRGRVRLAGRSSTPRARRRVRRRLGRGPPPDGRRGTGPHPGHGVTALATFLAVIAGLAGSVQVAVMARLGERVGVFAALAWAAMLTAGLGLGVALV